MSAIDKKPGSIEEAYEILIDGYPQDRPYEIFKAIVASYKNGLINDEEYRNLLTKIFKRTGIVD